MTDAELIARLRALGRDFDDWDTAADRIEALTDKLAKAAELVEEAYSEGFAEGYDGGWIAGDYRKPWKKSALFATITNLKKEASKT
jgi:hypothetical protein